MCVYIGMYGKIRNKQGIEQNRSKKKSTHLKDFCDCFVKILLENEISMQKNVHNQV